MISLTKLSFKFFPAAYKTLIGGLTVSEGLRRAKVNRIPVAPVIGKLKKIKLPGNVRIPGMKA